MYKQFFQLRQQPFSIAPDPRYLFMSQRHREALAHLLYGVGSGGGFVLLTGEIGAGKTTICRCFLAQIPENCRVAYIFNPKLSVGELLQTICEEFRISAPAAPAGAISAKQHVDALNAWLLQSHAAGCNNVLIIDEAQNLSSEVLEQLRLLTNLETSERKLLQIILIGQPELRDILARPELEQLSQRVIARYHLDALSLQETAAYIHYRLSVAAAADPTIFPAAVVPRIHRITGGVPRRINLLCDRALLGAYALGRHDIDAEIITRASEEVFGATSGAAAGAARAARVTPPRRRLLAMAAAVAVLCGCAAVWAWQQAVALPDPALQAVLAGEAGKFKLSHSLATLPGLSARDSEAVPAEARLAGTDGAPTDAGGDETSALRLLGQLWGMALGSADPCAEAQTRSIMCYRGAGGLEELRRLGRPAVLRLQDAGGASQHALLTALDESGAELRMTGSDAGRRISRDELEKRFAGEFVTFWRAPPGFAGALGAGDNGEAVDWLNAQLSQLDGGLEAAPGQPYGTAMARHVRRFQQLHGLEADGIAGARTLMALNRAAGVPEPALLQDQALAARQQGD